jgi:sugar (pentulose or hexulose) kinase
MPTRLLGLDLGTTHCKAGLFAQDGTLLRIASRPSPTRRAPPGETIYDPQEVWETAAAAIREAIEGASADEIAAMGIASMAETGMLVDRESGAPRSALIPWFDPAATPQAESLSRAADPLERFCRTGIQVQPGQDPAAARARSDFARRSGLAERRRLPGFPAER